MTHITLETRGHVLLMGINRPEKRNAFSLAMYGDLGLAYGRLDSDPNLRVGVLFAEGAHFTGGLDLAEWAPVMAQAAAPPLPDGAREPLGLDPGNRVSKPIVIATQGYCYTIGLELALAADIRIAAEDTRFAMLEVRRGLMPTGGGTIRLPAEIGWGNAMRYLLTGDEMTAREALRLGLVQEVTPPGRERDAAIALAEHIAHQAPLAVQAVLRSGRIMLEKGEQASIADFDPMQKRLMQTEDIREGVQSFIERRAARFQGR